MNVLRVREREVESAAKASLGRSAAAVMKQIECRKEPRLAMDAGPQESSAGGVDGGARTQRRDADVEGAGVGKNRDSPKRIVGVHAQLSVGDGGDDFAGWGAASGDIGRGGQR